MNNKTSQPTPNDQRADVKNPNNPAHKDAQDNHGRQLNPQDPKHQPAPEPQPSPGKKEK
jgi:hypothetical protein